MVRKTKAIEAAREINEADSPDSAEVIERNGTLRLVVTPSEHGIVGTTARDYPDFDGTACMKIRDGKLVWY